MTENNTPAPEKSVRAWSRTAITGLYQRTDTGTFYSRYSLNGRRTWRSLETDVFTIAKLKHARRTGIVEEARQAGHTITGECRTMGALARSLESEIAGANVNATTKRCYRDRILRLQKAWPSDFETASVRSIDLPAIVALRNRLRHEVVWSTNNTPTKRVGYAPACVNQALSTLKMMLEIAVKKHVIPANPFDERGVLQASVFLPPETRRPEIQTNENMERIFAEMARVPNADTYDESTLAFLQRQALASSDHARFLAYSGMRLEEGNSAVLMDDHGTTFFVRGTKTENARRTIPVVPAFRALLDRLKAGMVGDSTPFLTTRTSLDPMARACARRGLPKVRHHDLRHYFTTVCVESGVPIPTVADWLGHSDGGALLAKTYRHLRDKHSIDAAKLVQFTPSPAKTESTGS
jgi:site-specific recombinase XerD